MRYLNSRNRKLKRKQRTRRVQRGGQQEFEIPHHTSAKQTCENKTGIPFYVFQTWKSHKVPKDMYTTMIENQRKNPCFEFYLFDDAESRKFIEHYFEPIVLETYDSLVPGTYKADLFRYCVLYIHGGIYLDAKFKIVETLKKIYETYGEFFLQDLLEPDVYNGIICVMPKQEYIKAMIDQVVENVKHNYYGPSPLAPTACTLVKTILTKYNKLGLIKLDFSCPSLGNTHCHHQVKDSDGRLLFDNYPTYRKEYELVLASSNKKYYADVWKEGKRGEGNSSLNKDSSGKFIKGIYSVGGQQNLEIPHFTPAKQKCENKTSIPFFVFQTCNTRILSNDMYKAFIENQQKNPCFDFYLFDDKECREFIKHYFEPDVLWAYDSIIPGTFKADLFRYCVIYIHGGVYMDSKIQPKQDLKNILETYGECFIEDLTPDVTYNGILMVPQKKDYIKAMINKIIENVKNNFYGVRKVSPTAGGVVHDILVKFNRMDLVKLKYNILNCHEENGEECRDQIKNKEGKLLFESYPSYRKEYKNLLKTTKKQYYAEIWKEGKPGEGNSTINKDSDGNFIKGIYRTILDNPTFHILIATGGRPSLKNMLDSLKTELLKGDAVTIVFDGPSAKSKSGFKNSWLIGHLAKINSIEQTPALGYWGHGVRTKYQSILTPRTTFIMHADDDDLYIKGSFDKLRKLCKDPTILYIPQMIFPDGNIQPSGKKYMMRNSDDSIRSWDPSLDVCEKVIDKNGEKQCLAIDFGTPCGIIPFNLANKEIWGNFHGGDWFYFNSLIKKGVPYEFLNIIIYKYIKKTVITQ